MKLLEQRMRLFFGWMMMMMLVVVMMVMCLRWWCGLFTDYGDLETSNI